MLDALSSQNELFHLQNEYQDHLRNENRKRKHRAEFGLGGILYSKAQLSRGKGEVEKGRFWCMMVEEHLALALRVFL